MMAGWSATLPLRRCCARARHDAGLTLEELSESSGVSVRALSDMERGRALGPQRRTVVLIADALKLEGESAMSLTRCSLTRSLDFYQPLQVHRRHRCR